MPAPVKRATASAKDAAMGSVSEKRSAKNATKQCTAVYVARLPVAMSASAKSMNVVVYLVVWMTWTAARRRPTSKRD